VTGELRPSLIPVANQHVPFVTAARLCGVDVPEPRVNGSRAHCPFEEYSHPDGGRDPAMRVYYDHAFCFAEWLWMTPVRIFALVNGIEDESAAEQLLDQTGWKPASYSEEWERLSSAEKPVDRESLAQALRVWLDGTYPEWASRQYDADAAEALARCLGLLDRVRTASDCQYWLDCARQVMTMYLRRTS
jgi:hypothetical protein